jgi:hypothetical protein
MSLKVKVGPLRQSKQARRGGDELYLWHHNYTQTSNEYRRDCVNYYDLYDDLQQI